MLSLFFRNTFFPYFLCHPFHFRLSFILCGLLQLCLLFPHTWLHQWSSSLISFHSRLPPTLLLWRALFVREDEDWCSGRRLVSIVVAVCYTWADQEQEGFLLCTCDVCYYRVYKWPRMNRTLSEADFHLIITDALSNLYFFFLCCFPLFLLFPMFQKNLFLCFSATHLF